MRVIALALVLAAAGATARAEPRLDAPPDLSVADPPPLRLSGLRPGQEVELASARRVEDKLFTAKARFRADARGRIDLGAAAPLSGDYAGVDKAGLFWSAKASRTAVAADPPAGEVRVEAAAAGRTLASAVLRARPDPARLVVEPVTAFPGAVFARSPGPGRRPVLIVLGGSEGGASVAKAFAPLFAARGYAVLGLPYYAPGYDPAERIPGLPTTFTDIPVDRLEAVHAWLVARPDVDADRIGVWGASKGSEFALIAATRFPWIKAVAAVVPTDVVWEGWGQAGPPTASFSWRGAPLPFQPYEGMEAQMARAARGERMELRPVHDAGRRLHPDRLAAARIPIERFKGPLVLVAGGEDAIWPSLEMARNLLATRRKAGLETVLVGEENAGHALGGPGYDPTTDLVGLGGEPAAIARARRLGWAATLGAFDRTLHPGATAP